MSEPRQGPHLHPADLARHALDGGEAPRPSDAHHLADCAPCRSRLAQFRRVVAAGRNSRPYDPLHAPPPRVWQAIRTQARAGRPAPHRATARRPFPGTKGQGNAH
ncbi:hypothetical protein ABZ446_45950 [Streptomyces sp. NPDC005813]|uniref:hypothetical protein n=1 Tax=Streptomyces sp. NPDC005813 TaxID=3155592 RepID=UPI003402F35B